MNFIAKLKIAISNLKMRISSDKRVNNFIQFVKNDKTVLRWRGFAGKVHPFLHKYFYPILTGSVCVIFLFLIMYGSFWKAPSDFPTYYIASVSRDEGLTKIADNFEHDHVIKSSFWFKVFVVSVFGQKRIIAGDYYFEKPVSVFTVTSRLLKGDFGLVQRGVLITEGENSTEIADTIVKTIPKFDKDGFVSQAKDYEGYLFPDTYFFAPNEKPANVIAVMRENFARETATYADDIAKSGHSLKDIVIVASIVEDETKRVEDKRIVAGIIWKRLKMGMPLQVDSSLRYVSGKSSSQITKSELEDKSNPYNTYANKGLPPTPISSPGIEAIKAAIAPTNTKYLYFLSDGNGGMHYAVDFAGHKANREAYMR